ncbi:3-hydroxyacyl-coenzyme A dehydrogenase [Nitzschia inconspicua]|uniref:3-hydroxyacyl-coenzyme A dehydrogenase n=1 Tax=Nitzschia inconspicua TaxID=303405 RepID=A0A9K3LIY9_9STRA|nr:3-hydroxyacyl-coenzyme A dehydrogenase [Nitzschia inconspicua]
MNAIARGRFLPSSSSSRNAWRHHAGKALTAVVDKRFLSLPTPGGTSGFQTVGCVGLGLMGHGICQVAATSGVHSRVVAYEKERRFLDTGRDRIVKSLDKLVEKGKMTMGFANDTLGRIEFTTDLDALKDTDFIVEAIIENMDLKEDLYTKLGELCKPETIFASNTSSLSIGEMAAFSGRPDKFVGVHFFNPVQLMKLVEVIKTDQTDSMVFDKCYKWVEDIGKIPVSCGDTPGFIVNRLLVPSLMQAMAMVDRNDASVKDVDIAMKLGAGHPMGPLHLADYIGLDTCLFIVQGWVDKYPEEPSFFIPDCLVAKVEAGDLGRKTGKGFYEWDGDKCGAPAS